jgi:hypothetical protein
MAFAILAIDLVRPGRPLRWGVPVVVALAGAALLAVTRWGAPLAEAEEILGHALRADDLTVYLQVGVLVASALALLGADAYLDHLPGCDRAGFYALALFAVTGMLVLVASGDLLTLFLGLELLSFPTYALCALRRDSIASNEAARRSEFVSSRSVDRSSEPIATIAARIGAQDTNPPLAAGRRFDTPRTTSVRFRFAMKSAPFPLLFALTLAAGSPAHATPATVAHGHGEERLALVADGDSFRVESGRFTRPIVLPPQARAASVEALGRGWLVAGSSPSAAGPELFFLRGDDRGEEILPAPPARVGAIRQSPVPFVAGDQILGTAWLEGAGARSFEVRFAPWTGEHFGAPEVVAPAGPGRQLAPAGTRLPDGRLVLIWAGFDGQDDEIWLSVRSVSGQPAAWSVPARVADDNATPDITPAIAPLGRGALLAWSRFDGSEYRLMTARFDGERVTGARYAAPPGTLYPSIEAGPSGPALLFRDAARSDWVLAELDSEGGLSRTARIAGESDDRPLVSFEGASVLWSFGDRSALSAWQ